MGKVPSAILHIGMEAERHLQNTGHYRFSGKWRSLQLKEHVFFFKQESFGFSHFFEYTIFFFIKMQNWLL